jgi:sporulation protein YlmC with PRC-barrel domain
MRLTDLRGKQVRTAAGDKLGRVHEVHCDSRKITALMVGAGSWIERMTAKRRGRRVPWDEVETIGDDAITLRSTVPKKPSASRSRQGTRRPSARRSRR